MARGFERVAATVYGESQDDDDDMSDFGEEAAKFLGEARGFGWGNHPKNSGQDGRMNPPSKQKFSRDWYI